MTEILRDQPDVLAQYHRTFRYILVDEYQDTNLVQYLWLRLLAQEHKNICCVGDDDQSIYSWRGAEVENILRFEKDFPGARIVRLESNYRSTAPILAAASGADRAQRGPARQDAAPGPQRCRRASRSACVGLWDSDEEARMVGERIEALRRDGHPLAEMAMLVRAGFQTRAFEERLITLGMPYRVVGGLRFYERAEIRDAIAYMRRAAPAGRRSGVRAHRQRAAARRRRGGAARDARARARARHAADATRRRSWSPSGGLRGRVREQRRGAAATASRAGARCWSATAMCVTRRDHAGRERLHRHVAAGQVARGAGAAGEPEGTGPRAGRFRDAGGLPRPRVAGDGERRERRGRPASA